MSDNEPSKKDHMCEYGCGQKANYAPEKGRKKYCCNAKYQKCPGFAKEVSKQVLKVKKKINTKKKAKKSLSIPVSSIDIMCEYGCGQPAAFFFPITKKYCCADNAHKCPVKRLEAIEIGKRNVVSEESKERIRKKLLGHSMSYKTRKKLSKTTQRYMASVKKAKEKERLLNEPPKMTAMCGYGCGKAAKYPPGKGRKRSCCNIKFRKCPGYIIFSAPHVDVFETNYEGEYDV